MPRGSASGSTQHGRCPPGCRAQAQNLQAAALDGEQFENDLIAGGMRLDQSTMAAVRHAIEQLEAASAAGTA